MLKFNIKTIFYIWAIVLCVICIGTLSANAQSSHKKKKTTTSAKSNKATTSKGNTSGKKKTTTSSCKKAVASSSKRKRSGTVSSKKKIISCEVVEEPVNAYSSDGVIIEEVAQPIIAANIAPVKDPSLLLDDDSLRSKYISLLNVLPEELPDMQLLRTVDYWYGTPYRYGGSTIEGIDCSGFSSTIMKNVYGITVPRTSSEQYIQTPKVADDSLQAGDLLFFHTTRSGISHVGVYLANNKFIHASTTNGVMVSDLNEAYWKRCYNSAGRVEKGYQQTVNNEQPDNNDQPKNN